MSEPQEVLEAWIAELLHGSEAAQAAAAEALGQMGPAAAPALCAALEQVQSRSRALQEQQEASVVPSVDGSDRSPRHAVCVRDEIKQNEERVCRLARVLQAVRDREALKPLFEALRRSHSREAHALAQALAPLGAPALPLLGEALESRETWVAMSAAEALAAVGGSEPARILARRLETAAHDLLRLCLIRCLGRLGDPIAVDVLRAVAAGSGDERRYAVEALGRIGDPRGFEVVLQCLASPRDAADLALASAALRALGGLADPRGIVPLVRALQDPRGELHGPAVEALAELAERRPVVDLRAALPVLRQRIRRPSGERESVVRACTVLADRIETLTAGLKSLPLPAGCPGPAPDQLPRPSEGSVSVPDSLPIPSETSGDSPDLGRTGRVVSWFRRKKG